MQVLPNWAVAPTKVTINDKGLFNSLTYDHSFDNVFPQYNVNDSALVIPSENSHNISLLRYDTSTSFLLVHSCVPENFVETTGIYLWPSIFLKSVTSGVPVK